MKTHRVLVIGVFVITSEVLLARGQDETFANTKFQAEFSRKQFPAPPPPLTWQEAPLSPSDGERGEPSALRAIVGTDQATVDERYNAVHALSRNLSRGEIAALYVFLKSPPAPKEENLPALRVLKNDILDVLIGQAVPPAGLTDTMIEIYRDPSQDKVSRDYAIQHLSTWYELGATDAPVSKGKIRAALREAAHDKSSIGGTALLGWHRISKNDAAFDKQEIDALALRLAQSDETHTATRITAIQVCAERGLKELLPIVTALSQARVCLPLRLSATAAINRLAGQEQTKQATPFAFLDNAEHNALQVAFKSAQQKEKGSQ